MLFSSLAVYCFLYYYVLMKLFSLWEAVKLERNPFSEIIFLYFWCKSQGILLTNPALGFLFLFLYEALAVWEITGFHVSW